MNSLQKYISNLKINTFLLSKVLQHKKKCLQHLKNFDERSLEILYDHEDAVFKHMVKRYLKKIVNFYVNWEILIGILFCFFYFVLWSINARLFHKLSHSYVFRHSCHPQGACNPYLSKLPKYFKYIFGHSTK
jgi:hypothetical protein